MIKHLKLAMLFFLLSSMQTFASHILGGELTYKYLGSNGPSDRPFRYLIRFVGYVDRVGNPAIQNGGSNWGCGNLELRPRLAIFNAGTNEKIFRVPNTVAPPTGLNQNDPVRIAFEDAAHWSLPTRGNATGTTNGVTNPCPFDPYFGGLRPLIVPVPPACVVQGLTNLSIAITDTSFEIQLPLSASGYIVKYQNCCRTIETTNLEVVGNGGDPGNAWVATIPSPIFVNSSPQFIGDAVPFFCLGDTATISNNAFDPDGDKLIYSFASPYSDNGSNVYPNQPYTEPSLAPYKTGFSQTQPFGVGGFISINPSTGLTRYFSPVAGKFSVAVDIQEYRTLSNGSEILLSTTRREFLILVQACAPNPEPVTPVLGSGGTIIKNEGDSVVFNVQAFDLDTMTLSATSQLLIPGNQTGSLASFPPVTGKDSVKTVFKWKIDCGITKGQTRSYSVQIDVKDRGCPPKTKTVVYTIIVNPFKAPPITGKDSLCSTGSGLSFTAPAGSTKLWKMLSGNIVGSSTSNSVNVNFPGDTARIKLVVTSGTGCKDSTSKRLTKVQLVPIVASAQSAFVCQDSTISLNAIGGYSNAKWSPSTGLSSTTIKNPKASPSDSIKYIITSNGPAGCVAKDSVNLTWIPKVANAGPDSILCSGLKRGIGAIQSTNYKFYSYQWLPATGLVSDTSFKTIATISNSGTTNQISTYVQRARHRASNCISTDTVRIAVKPLPAVNAGLVDPAVICSGGKTILGTDESASATYQWTPTNGVASPNSDTTTVSLNPDSLGAPLFKYYLQKTEVLLSPLPGEPSCTNRDSITVQVNPLPFFSLASKDSICSGLSTNIGTQNQSGFNYQWSPSRGLSNVNNAQTGISLINLSQNPGDTLYKLLVTNSLTGCKREKSMNIRVNPLPIVNAGTDAALCSGDTIKIGETNQTGFSYAWTPVNGLISTTISNPGIRLINPNVGGASLTFQYKLTKQNGITKCRNADSLNVKVKPLPTVNAGPDTVTICSGLKTVLGISESVSALYQWTPLNGLLNPARDTTTVTLNPDSVSIQFYTYKVKKTEGIVLPGEPACSNVDSIKLRVNPLPFFSLAGKDSICSGLSRTIGTTNQTGFLYQWSPLRGINSPSSPQTAISLVNSGQIPGDTIYTILVTNGQTTCKREKSINIRVNPLPIVNAGTDAALCSGDTIIIGETNQSGFEYAWTPVNGLISTTISNPGIRLLNPNVGGASLTFPYKLTKENSITKCKNADSLNVKVKPLPTVNAGPDTVTICSGLKTVLGISESVSALYQWTPINGLLNPARDTTTVTLNPDSVSAQFYTYKVKKTEGIVLPGEPACSNVDSIKLRVNPLPFFNLSSKDSICSGLSTTIGTTNQSGFNYQWSPGRGLVNPSSPQTSISLVNLSQTPGDTIYNLLVTNGQSTCKREKSIRIRVNPLPIVSAGIDTALCSGDSIKIGEANQSGFAYAWTPVTGIGSTNISFPNISLINSNVGGASQTFPYKITKTNTTTTCRKADSLNVTVKPLPIAIAAASDTVVVCSKSNLQIGSSALASHLYTWTPDSALGSSTVSNPVVNINNPGQSVSFATYQVNVTNSISRCKNKDVVTVKINPLPIVPLVYSDTAVCSKDSIEIGGFFTNGYTYSWSPRTQLSDSTKVLTKFAAINNTDNPVSYVLNLQVKINATNCINNKPLNVVVNPLPDANAGADKEVCSGDSIQIGIDPLPGRQYSWTPTIGLSNPNIANPKLSLLNNGTTNATVSYQLSVVDITKSTRCDSSDGVTLTIKPLPNVVAAATDSVQICSTIGLNLGINPETGLAYQWSPAINLSSGSISNPVFTSTTPTGSASLLYVLTATNTLNQCLKSDSVHIQVNSLPVVNVGSLDSLCSGDTITIGPGNILAPNLYQWTPSTGIVGSNPINPGLTLVNNGTTVSINPYKFIITNIQTGCRDSATLNVRVNPLPQVDAGLDRAICSGSSSNLGIGSVFGNSYLWASNNGLSLQNISNPVFSMTNTNGPKNDTLVLTMTNNTTTCKKSDEVVVTTNPRPVPVTFGTFSPTVCPFTKNVNYSATNSVAGNTYVWEISGGVQSAGTNTNAINVDWGNTNPNAKIYTTPTNIFGCVGNKDSISLAVNSNLTPVKPFGDTEMCSYSKLNKLYSTVPTPGSNYKWKFLNPDLDSATTSASFTNLDWNTNDGIGKIWIQEQSSTVDPGTGTPIKCFGRSDTLFVRINPSPDSTLLVAGNGQVCGSVSNQEVFNLNGVATSSYNWEISPTANIVSGQGSDSLTVNWNTPGNYIVRVTETSNKGCLGRPISKPIEVNALPAPGLVSSSLNICPNDRSKGYLATSAPGFSNSTFEWTVSGGTSPAKNNSFIAVEWDQSGVYSLKLTETTVKGCKKDTILPLQYDGSALDLQNVSLLENDDNQVELTFNMSSQGTNNSFISILRRELSTTPGKYDTVQARIPRNIEIYIDQPGATNSLAYQYVLVSKNICNKVIESFPKNTILLNVAALQNEGGAKLNWNAFNGWPNGVNEYSVLRKVDKQQALSPYETIADTFKLPPGPKVFYKVASEGFEQCWRVIANEKDGEFKSFSNAVCVKFLNPLEFYSLITPNGDNLNDKFEIKNLHLYPENELRISDRWGQELYKRTNYNNSDLWDGGSNLEGDVFFFKFTLTNTGQEFNGWVTVARK